MSLIDFPILSKPKVIIRKPISTPRYDPNIMKIIFSYLHVSQLLKLRQVCRHWYYIFDIIPIDLVKVFKEFDEDIIQSVLIHSQGKEYSSDKNYRLYININDVKIRFSRVLEPLEIVKTQEKPNYLLSNYKICHTYKSMILSSKKYKFDVLNIK